MNSTNHSLLGLQWSYEGRVSMTKGKGYQGNGVSRTLFCYPNIADVPAELFACKTSLSPKPDRKGKLVFKYLSFRFDPQAQFSDLVPTSASMDTDLNEIKNIVMTSLASVPTAEVSLQVKLYGKWKNIKTGTGDIALYNDDAVELQNADPLKSGEAPYYIKKDAIITVALKGMSSAQGNDYIASELSTTAPSSQVLQMRGASAAIWDGTDNTVVASAPVSAPATTATPTGTGTPTGGPIW